MSIRVEYDTASRSASIDSRQGLMRWQDPECSDSAVLRARDRNETALWRMGLGQLARQAVETGVAGYGDEVLVLQDLGVPVAKAEVAQPRADVSSVGGPAEVLAA